jgi:hypothetical protein
MIFAYISTCTLPCLLVQCQFLSGIKINIIYVSFVQSINNIILLHCICCILVKTKLLTIKSTTAQQKCWLQICTVVHLQQIY